MSVKVTYVEPEPVQRPIKTVTVSSSIRPGDPDFRVRFDRDGSHVIIRPFAHEHSFVIDRHDLSNLVTQLSILLDQMA